MRKKSIVLSSLNHTWILDLDGTILKHNGYKDGEDVVLPYVKEFFENIPNDDMIIILTAREEKYKEETVKFLKQNDIKFNQIIFDVPVGERILINDAKPSGLKMSHAINTKRDSGLKIDIKVDENL